MERFERRRSETGAAAAAAPAAGDGAAAHGAVQVISGALTDQIEGAGMTVGELFALLQGPYNIAPGALTLVNGTPAEGDQRLEPGDTLEFARRAGEKGSRFGSRCDR